MLVYLTRSSLGFSIALLKAMTHDGYLNSGRGIGAHALQQKKIYDLVE